MNSKANVDLVSDAWGRPKSIQDYSLFSGLFTYDVPNELWKTEANGIKYLNTSLCPTITSLNGALKVTTGAGTGDYSIVSSRRHPRYQPNRGHLYSSSVIVEDPNVGITDFGLITADNGVFFRVTEGELYCVRRSNGVEVSVIHAKLDTDANGLTNVFLDKGCIYDIQFQWRCVGNYYFYVNQQVVGKMVILNTLDGLSIANPALPVGFKCTNTGNGIPSLLCGCVDVTSEGGTPQSQVLKPVQSMVTANLTNEVVLVVRVNELFKGKYNTRDMAIQRIMADVNKKGDISVWLTRDSSAVTTALPWVNADGGSISMLQPSVSGTVTFTQAKADKLASLPCVPDVPNVYTNPNPKVIEQYLTNGDYLIITVEGSAILANVFVELGAEV